MSDTLEENNTTREGVQIVPVSRNPSVDKCLAQYRGYNVPFIEIFKVPVDDEGNQVYPISDSTDGPLIVDQHHGRYNYELSLDNRWLFDFHSVEDIEKIIPLLADAMAVAAGYACHGSSNRLNLHGPTIFGNHQDVPGGAVISG